MDFDATPTAFSPPTQIFELPANLEEPPTIVVTFEPLGIDPSIPVREIAKTEHFDVYTEEGFVQVQAEKSLEKLEEVFVYVSNRLGTSIEINILLSFRKRSDTPCPARGVALPGSPPEIIVFVNEETDMEELLGILAHEVGHIITIYGSEDGAPDDSALNEGWATWAAGNYWVNWQVADTFDAIVRSYVEDSEYLPLYQNYDFETLLPHPEATATADCLERRTVLYTEWASFLDFLIQRYGMAKFSEFLRTSSTEVTDSKMIIRPPDYEGVYGSSLNQLEAAWLQHIMAQP